MAYMAYALFKDFLNFFFLSGLSVCLSVYVLSGEKDKFLLGGEIF